MDNQITENDLIRALEEATTAPDNPTGALTTKELAIATGWTKDKVRAAIAILKAQGRAEMVKKAQDTIADVSQPIYAYRLINVEKEE